MRIGCAFDPDPRVHTRCALVSMRIRETTSGGGFDAHWPSIRFHELITWAIIQEVA